MARGSGGHREVGWGSLLEMMKNSDGGEGKGIKVQKSPNFQGTIDWGEEARQED